MSCVRKTLYAVGFCRVAAQIYELRCVELQTVAEITGMSDVLNRYYVFERLNVSVE